MKICASIPAAAAYAAMALAALPADGIAIFRMPSSTHMETAHASPGALNEAVGLSPWPLPRTASGRWPRPPTPPGAAGPSRWDEALVLHPELLRADARAQPLRPHQRCPALAQGHHVG